MNRGLLNRALALLVLVMLAVSTSGCFLFTLAGVANEIDGTLIVTAETDVITATCVDPLKPFANVECTYIIDDPDGAFEITSSAQLISEFGVLGVIIDPLIMQIPSGATNVVATYDAGRGNTGNLDVLSGYKSIPVDFNRHLIAEPGQQFVIAELPGGVPFEGVQFAFGISFEMPQGAQPPVSVKPLLAAKFEDGFGSIVYYSPLLPCTTDMSQVGSFSIVGGDIPVDIPISNPPAGCSGEQYLYLGFGAFPCDFDQDDDVDLNDLFVQARARNAPALPGDRFDANADGIIDLNDVRRCALQCTTKGCRSEPIRPPELASDNPGDPS